MIKIVINPVTGRLEKVELVTSDKIVNRTHLPFIRHSGGKFGILPRQRQKRCA